MARRKSVIGAVVLCCVLLVSLALSASAQNAMRIVRPVDGSTVREVVNVLVPVSCVPDGGFITCIVDGRYECATGDVSEDGRNYVYRWNTKAAEISAETGESKGHPKDGKHVIIVQAYGSDGKRSGQPVEVSVYVKNDASADMPSNGLKLRYKNTPGSSSDYHFKYIEDIKSVQGATTLAKAIGEAVEGAEGTVRRSVEDAVYGDSVLVRQKLVDTVVLYYAGTPVSQTNLNAKSSYQVEDSTGHVTYVMSSSSPGVPIGVDLPILPAKAVKIGDSWTEPMKLFKHALTGESTKLNATSTLEGLEWEGGQPCAKIKTQFNGVIKLPYSTLLKRPLALKGEATTYFAYRSGKVVTFSVRATAEPELPYQMLSAWFDQIMLMKNPAAGANSDTAKTLIPSSGGPDSQPVKMKMEFRQVVELVR